MSNQRKIFIQALFQHLKDREYLLLKFIENTLDEIDTHSDLDILLPSKNWKSIQVFAEEQESVVRITKHLQGSMCQLFLYFRDGGFLQIDLLFELVRKDLVYLTNEYVLSNQVEKSGIKTYSDFCLLEHLVMFNQLNYSGVPQKYLSYFQSLPNVKLRRILLQLEFKYDFPITTILQLDKYDKNLRDKLVTYLEVLKVNNWISRKKRALVYTKDIIASLKRQRGFLISFSGVDGAGKSTILEATRRLLSEKFRKKTVVIRHRPSLLPILSSFIYGKQNAEKRAATKPPRQGNNKSKLKSLLRFAYYYSDHLFGRAYIFCKYQLRNYIVLYDRYYFDLIIDGKRTNIELDQTLPKWLYRFVQKPKLNFFLYAPVETILTRKKELSPEAITTLTSNYKSLFDELANTYPQQYSSIQNIHLEETLTYISQQIKQHI